MSIMSGGYTRPNTDDRSQLGNIQYACRLQQGYELSEDRIWCLFALPRAFIIHRLQQIGFTILDCQVYRTSLYRLSDHAQIDLDTMVDTKGVCFEDCISDRDIWHEVVPALGLEYPDKEQAMPVPSNVVLARKPRKPKRELDMNNLPQALSRLEAMEVIGVTEATYYRHIHPLVQRGVILSRIIGRQRRIVTSSLLTWLKSADREGWK
jgi:hypothetical protein